MAGCSGDRPNSQEAVTASRGTNPSFSNQETIPLNYTPVDTESQVSNQIGYTEIFEKKRLNGHIVVYTKDQTSSELHIGQDFDRQIAEFGTIGEEVYLNEISIRQAQVFGEQFIIASGLCGANCSINYLFQDFNGKLKTILVVNDALVIADLNRDGMNELITMRGTPTAEIRVYKKVSGQIMSVNINEALGAIHGVFYNTEENRFETSMDHNVKKYRYCLKGDCLELQ